MATADDLYPVEELVLARRRRSHTVSIKRLSKRELEHGRSWYPVDPAWEAVRPATFGDCERAGWGDDAPCPWISCAQHLAYDVDERTGSIKENMPGVAPEDMPHTCALRVANAGGITLEEVGAALNLTRERVRQIETRAMAQLRALDALACLADAYDDEPAGPAVARTSRRPGAYLDAVSVAEEP